MILNLGAPGTARQKGKPGLILNEADFNPAPTKPQASTRAIMGTVGDFLKDRYEATMTPTDQATGVGDFLTRVVPRSVAQNVIGALEFIPRTAGALSEGVTKGLDIATSGRGSVAEGWKAALDPVAETAQGMTEFMGKPFGLYGADAAKEAWLTDPVGATSVIAPGLPKGLRIIKKSTPYRRLTIKERGLFDAGVKAAVDSGELTPAQIRELWKTKANREGLINKYVRGTEPVTPKETGAPMTAHGADTPQALPAGQGFDLKGEPYQYGTTVGEPYGPDIIRPSKRPNNIVDAEFTTTERRGLPAPEGEPLALPPGQGFDLQTGTPFLPVKSTAIRLPHEPVGENGGRILLAPEDFAPAKKEGGKPGKVLLSPEDFAEPVVVAGAAEKGMKDHPAPIEIVEPGASHEAVISPVKSDSSIVSADEATNKALGDQFGVKYNGKMGANGKEVHLYTEPKYGATISLQAGDDLAAKIKDTHGKFEAAGNKELHPNLKKAIQKPLVIPEDAAIKIKSFTKDTLQEKHAAGEIEPDAPVLVFTKIKGDLVVHDRKSFDNLIQTDYISSEGGKKYVRKNQLSVEDLRREDPAIQERIKNLTEGQDVQRPTPGSVHQRGPEAGQIQEPLKNPLKNQRGSMPLSPESEIVRTIQATKGAIKEAMPHLENLGRRLYEAGTTKFTDWYKGMEKAIGPVWRSFTRHARDIFARISKPLVNEKGKVGFDINRKPPTQKSVREGVKSSLEKIEAMAPEERDAIRGTAQDPIVKRRRIITSTATKIQEHIKRIEASIANRKAKDPEWSDVKARESIGKLSQELLKTTDKADRYAPEIFRSERDALMSVEDLPAQTGWQNPIRMIERTGSKIIKDIFYDRMKTAEDQAVRHFETIYAKAETFRKGLSRDGQKRIGIYAISRQKDGVAILHRMGFKDADIPATLTGKELDAYNWMRRGYEAFYTKIQDARILAGKEPIGKVENYFTFAREMSLLEEAGISPIFAKGDYINTYLHRKTTAFGYGKKRVGGLFKVNLNAFDVFEKYMESATRHYYLSPHIAKGREMMNTLKDPATGENWLLRNEKPRLAKVLTAYLDNVAGQHKSVFSEILGASDDFGRLLDKATNKLSKNLAVAILGGAVRTVLIQPTSLVNTYAMLGERFTAAGVKNFVMRDKAVLNSRVLRSRKFDVTVADSTTGAVGKIGEAKQAAARVMLKPLKMIDYAVAEITWHGAYAKALHETLSPREAIQYADDTVTKTQASAMPTDLAPVQRQALGKALTLFQTFVINQWNFMAKDVMGIRNPQITKAQAAARSARFFIGVAAVNTLFEMAGINSPFPAPITAWQKSVEAGDDAKDTTFKIIRELASWLPGPANAIRYGSDPLGPVAGFVGDVAGTMAGREPTYMSDEDKKIRKAQLAGMALGVPGTRQAAQMARIKGRGGSLMDQSIGRYPD